MREKRRRGKKGKDMVMANKQAAWELRKSPIKAQPKVPDSTGKDKRDLRVVECIITEHG